MKISDSGSGNISKGAPRNVSIDDLAEDRGDLWECRIDPCREIVLMRYPLKKRP